MAAVSRSTVPLSSALYALPTPPRAASSLLSLSPVASSVNSPTPPPASVDTPPLSVASKRFGSPASSDSPPGHPGHCADVSHLRDCRIGSDEGDRIVERGLVVDDRAQMQEFMSYATQAADSEMAAEVVNLLVPRNDNVPAMAHSEIDHDRVLLQRYILYWTSLTPHSLCVLISTIILLERLKMKHPRLSATGRLKDTTLRVVFSAYLIAMKLCTEVSYLNHAFQSRTPWSLDEMNQMEKELLAHLDWQVYIRADEILARGRAFWHQREVSDARHYKDDGAPDVQALMSQNLFFVSSVFP